MSSVLIVVAALAGTLPAGAGDGIALELGRGTSYSVDMARIAWTHEWSAPLWSAGLFSLGGYWDAAIGRWTPKESVGGNHQVNDLGITPVFRLSLARPAAIAPFAELAVGAHYVSDHRIFNGRDMTTHFQFGDLVGAGVSLGESHAVDLGVRLQHLSNGGLKNPNPGINFYQVRAAYHF